MARMINTIKNSRDYLREIFRKPDHIKSGFRYKDILFFLRFAKPVWRLGIICMGLMFITSGMSALLPLGRKAKVHKLE